MKKPVIAYDQFATLDIRIGEIVEANLIENSKKLIKLTVDLGNEYSRVTILTGIAEFYTPGDLINKKMLFLANLEPRPMAGETSHGMMLAADIEGRPLLIELPDDTPLGIPLK
ncbi:hypothetical protein A2690_01025 [Candidatus Roizmanbacteria bacterium RIFCSPHIGHO2_01_FULL_39_12b]|uniref:tRNA-binding domain-containing protein n=1 Tax=Candidatus Roizmanbacteria bacterium RIFCSPHIGHO2_01_FULL_39_12b TaxID=1802030 RepID=A0A1F7GA48_9BACT|nr:MAG: hypothetical protein A2690_01025 [Candidatus Roizmanbacteria bacterium RIFCSPHIGHO2_01_FULL_39_12b]OGK45950.1 MAG: hypothetical protein A3B46_01010 [Candidatus Roizmanbacteria bacterium RIFCSPLOWO2_01_FULL_39_19]